ncbi:MAG: cold shock domain-containing protein [Patescibacteria group bacterium]
MTGKIKKLMMGKNYGFIAVDEEGKDDVFFHESELVGVRFDELRENDNVTFDIKKSVKGMNAVQVTRV